MIAIPGFCSSLITITSPELISYLPLFPAQGSYSQAQKVRLFKNIVNNLDHILSSLKIDPSNDNMNLSENLFPLINECSPENVDIIDNIIQSHYRIGQLTLSRCAPEVAYMPLNSDVFKLIFFFFLMVMTLKEGKSECGT